MITCSDCKTVIARDHSWLKHDGRNYCGQQCLAKFLTKKVAGEQRQNAEVRQQFVKH